MCNPLDASKQQNRLLRLLGRDDEAELRCRLSLASLDDDSMYEAVSYVWGTRNDPDTMHIEDFEQRLSITKNLESMLRSLRYPHQTRTL